MAATVLAIREADNVTLAATRTAFRVPAGAKCVWLSGDGDFDFEVIIGGTDPDGTARDASNYRTWLNGNNSGFYPLTKEEAFQANQGTDVWFCLSRNTVNAQIEFLNEMHGC